MYIKNFYEHITTVHPITRNNLELDLDYEYRHESESQCCLFYWTIKWLLLETRGII